MNYTVVIEGQNIPVPEEIGTSDENLKRVLAPYYPDVANAMITRVEKDGTTTVNVVKKAGTKGSRQFDSLANCAGGKNPIIALFEELGEGERELDPEELLAMDGRIEAVLEEGRNQAQAINGALERLVEARPQNAQGIVVGF